MAQTPRVKSVSIHTDYTSSRQPSASIRYGSGRGGFCPQRPHRYTGLGSVFCSFSQPHPRPGPSHTQSPDGPLYFTTKNILGPVRGTAGVGPWPRAERGKGEKYAPLQAGERARAGNFAGGRVLWGPGGPVMNTT